MKNIATLLLIFVLMLSFSGCKMPQKAVEGVALGTFYNVQYTSKYDYKTDIKNLLEGIENTFSTAKQDSQVSSVNSAASNQAVELSEEAFLLIKHAFLLTDTTNNAYNSAIFPLVLAWGFNPPYNYTNRTSLPSLQDIENAKTLSSTAFFNFDESNNSITKVESGAKIDLGGIAKGYAVDVIIKFLLSKGIGESLINLGGNIGAIGKSYKIGITPPRQSKYGFVLSFTLNKNEICATSGDYERYFDLNDTRYHHILDTDTGSPSNSDLMSATIISTDGALSDALSTASIVLGKDLANQIILQNNAKAILITKDKKVYLVGDITANIKDGDYVLQ